MKKLNILNDACQFKVDESGTLIPFNAFDGVQPVHVDSTDTPYFRLKNDLGFLKSVNAEVAVGGYIFNLNTKDLVGLVSGTYQIELVILNQQNEENVYPDEGFCTIQINANALTLTGNQIPTMSLDSFKETVLQYIHNAEADIEDKFSNYVAQLNNTALSIANEALDNTKDLQTIKADKSYVDSKISQIGTGVTMVASQADLPQNGGKGVYITADTDHRWYWNGGSWVDAGVENSNSDVPVKLANVLDTYADLSKAAPWGAYHSNTVIVDGNTALLAVNNAVGGNDLGIQIPTSLPRIPNEFNDSVYIDFDLSVVNNSKVQNKIDVWITKGDGSLIKQFWTGTKADQSVEIKLSSDDFSSNHIPEDFRTLIVFHSTNKDFGNATLVVKNFRVNYYANNKPLTERAEELAGLINTDKKIDYNSIQSTRFDLNQASGWNLVSGDQIIHNQSEVIMKSPNSGKNAGIQIARNVDSSVTQYITIKMFSSRVRTSIFVTKPSTGNYGISSAGNIGDNGNVVDREVTIKAELTPEKMQALGITDQIGFVIGSSASVIAVRSIEVSPSPVGSELPKTIDTLNQQSFDRNINFYGQPVKGIDSNSKVTIDGLNLGTVGAPFVGDKGVITKIYAYVPNESDYQFTVGQIDQYSRLVNSKDYSVHLLSGYNEVDTSSLNMQINNGDLLFMDLSTAGVYSAGGNFIQYQKAQIRDSNHLSTNPSYQGQIFYETNNLVPFAYEAGNLSANNEIDSLKNDVQVNTQAIQILNSPKNKLLISQSGKKFRLVVSDNGELSAVSSIPKKVAIFGNSLTKERGDIGMAASDQYHDWYHYVTEYIKKANPSVEINSRTNVAMWEQSTNSNDRLSAFNSLIKPVLGSDTDLVILQLGDNVNNAARHATYATDVASLLNNIRQASPKAQIMWVGAWFTSFDDIMSVPQKAVENVGGTFVEIKSLQEIPSNSSYVGAKRTGIDGSTWTVSNPGEAAHPGDNGHLSIGNKVIDNFEF